MARKTKEEKRIESEVDAAFKKHSHGVQIPMMEINTILNAGRKAGKEGKNIDEAIQASINIHRAN